LKLKFICGSYASIGIFFGELTEEHLDEVSLGKVGKLSSGRLGRSLDNGSFSHKELGIGASTDGRVINVGLGNVGLRLSLDHGTGLVLRSLQFVVSNRSRSHDLRWDVKVGLSSELSLGFKESLDFHQVHFHILSLFGSLELLHSLFDGLLFFLVRLGLRVFHLGKLLHEGLSFLSGSDSSIGVLEHVRKVLEFLKRGVVVLERNNVSNGENSKEHE
jgi:hypothetical protein